ncbi:MAG: protein-L-isoaspartate(D-aspartate) O-methyltransferase [Candidatus Omnitrophica bacterium]|nr:protein-L-isoaspartate(D-aspartate) O-methyltransferase [Candidatus Omnitrophota bacterium]
MLQNQIIARGVTNPRILEAMQCVPRHLFIPEESRDRAYEDYPIMLPEESATISQPYMTAYMTDALNAQPSDRVLEIGTGSGYQAALLSHLCREVYTIERYSTLSRSARDVIQFLGLSNVFFRVGDGLNGWPEKAPFTKIMVTAAMCDAPSSLLNQLEEDGMLLIPLGNSRHQTLIRFTKKEGRFNMQDLIQCVFVPLFSDARDMTQSDHDY